MPEEGPLLTPARRRLIVLGALILVGLIVHSFIRETVLPLHRAGRRTEMLLNLGGFPVVLGGTALFVRGGFLLVRDTFRVWISPELAENTARIRSKSPHAREAARANRAILFGAWKPGLLRLAGGFALIAIGSVMINLLKIQGQDQMM